MEKNRYDIESMMNAEDVAAMLGVSTAWVYRQARTGRIEHYRVGKHLRFRPEFIEAFRKPARS